MHRFLRTSLPGRASNLAMSRIPTTTEALRRTDLEARGRPTYPRLLHIFGIKRMAVSEVSPRFTRGYPRYTPLINRDARVQLLRKSCLRRCPRRAASTTPRTLALRARSRALRLKLHRRRRAQAPSRLRRVSWWGSLRRCSLHLAFWWVVVAEVSAPDRPLLPRATEAPIATCRGLLLSCTTMKKRRS